jgi:hypothetical protein
MPGAQLRFDDQLPDGHEQEWLRVIGDLEPLPFPADEPMQQLLEEGPLAERPEDERHRFGLAASAASWSPVQLSYAAVGRQRVAGRYRGGPGRELAAATDAGERPAAGAGPAQQQGGGAAGAAATGGGSAGGEGSGAPGAEEEEEERRRLQQLNEQRAGEYRHHMPRFQPPGPTSESPLGSTEKEPPSSSFPA